MRMEIGHRVELGGLTMLLLAALAVGAAWPRPVRPARPGPTLPLVLLRTNALHTDIGIPVTPALRERWAFLAEVGIPIGHPRLSHVLVGWGAEGFYPNNGRPHRIGPGDLLAAVFGDESVLRFAPLADPGGPWADRNVLPVSQDALDALVRFVEGTLERDADGRFRPLDHPGITDLDHFFHARPTFAVPLCCNVWVSRALAEAGIATGRWTPMPQTLFASLRWRKDQRSRA